MTKRVFSNIISVNAYYVFLFYAISILFFFNGFSISSLLGFPENTSVLSAEIALPTMIAIFIAAVLQRKYGLPNSIHYKAVYFFLLWGFIVTLRLFFLPAEAYNDPKFWLKPLQDIVALVIKIFCVVMPTIFLKDEKTFLKFTDRLVYTLLYINLVCLVFELMLRNLQFPILYDIYAFLHSADTSHHLITITHSFPRVSLMASEPSHAAPQLLSLWPIAFMIYVDKSNIGNALYEKLCVLSYIGLFFLTFSTSAFPFFVIQVIFLMIFVSFYKIGLSKLNFLLYFLFTLLLALFFFSDQSYLDQIFGRILSMFNDDSIARDQSGLARMITTLIALKVFLLSPLLGVGAGCYHFYVPIVMDSVFLNYDLSLWGVQEILEYAVRVDAIRSFPIHHSLLSILVHFGLIGFLIFISWFVLLLWRLFVLFSKKIKYDSVDYRAAGFVVGLATILQGQGINHWFYLMTGLAILSLTFAFRKNV